MNALRYQDFEHGITAVDTDYIRPRLDASHLIVRDGRAAIVDTGPNASVPLLLAALREKGLAPEQVDYVLLTHVHLDHAGGAGLLMQSLPEATLVVHPRGARHMADPGRLEAGVREVYGDEAYERMYGTLRPVPAERIHEVADGETLRLGRSELEFIHTPGHALHHYCVVDPGAAAVFTGDTFGLSYRELDTSRGPFIMATTSPVQFDPAAAHASIDRIISYRPEAAFLTHYSRVTDLARLAADLHRDVDAHVEIAEACQALPERVRRMQERLWRYFLDRLRAHGCTLPEATIHELLEMDIRLNAQGLDAWLSRRDAA